MLFFFQPDLRGTPADRLRIMNARDLLPLVSAALLALTAGCSSRPNGAFQGYVEGEFVYPAAPVAGILTNLAVARGAEVRAGQLLFVLEAASETAAVREAEQRVAQAKSRLENFRKGRRPSEIASLEAQLQRAVANLQLSEVELNRLARLREANVVSPEELDRAKSRREADQAQVTSMKADLETARLGAREDEITAAEADLAAVEAALARALWVVEQKTQSAPTAGRIQDTLYRPGEFVPAGSPVVVLLPPENIKARFFVPETDLASVKIGQAIAVSFDGATAPVRATINYVSAQAEFTPPVIYSQQTRAKLVYLVEAAFAPADAVNLHPGQPVEVRPNP